jgi:hypothetical protein
MASRATRIAAAVSAGLASLALAGLALAGPAFARPVASPAHKPPAHGFKARVVINGADLKHTFVPAGSSTPKTEPLTSPDDITVLGHHIFTAFQNGVGPQGQPSTSDGNTDSTVVEFTPNGHVVHQWDLHGKCDGITADAQLGVLIADVNEDANSSVYWIRPGAPKGAQITHFHYNHSPLPQNGGTDAISIYHGLVLISASAPGTVTGSKPAPQPTYPAVYRVTFKPAKHLAVVRALFYDEASAKVANVGKSLGTVVNLALTDPDSNELVPASAPRFAGDFMLTSQGDQEQIFVSPHGKLGSHLSVLSLTHSVDDTAWARSAHGKLYVANTGGGTIDVITGPFRPGSVLVAVTPCDQNDAPATCPGPGFPPNYLGQLNPWTGNITAVNVSGPTFGPQGMVFIGPGWNVVPG